MAEFTAKTRQLGKNAGYTIRQGAYDLRKLRGKGLAVKPGTTRRYHTPAEAARTIAALLALRDQVIAPILAGARSPRRGRKPAHWTTIDRDYETWGAGKPDRTERVDHRLVRRGHRRIAVTCAAQAWTMARHGPVSRLAVPAWLGAGTQAGRPAPLAPPRSGPGVRPVRHSRTMTRAAGTFETSS